MYLVASKFISDRAKSTYAVVAYVYLHANLVFIIIYNNYFILGAVQIERCFLKFSISFLI